MGRLADALGDLEVAGSSPDGKIECVVGPSWRMYLSFVDEDAYYEYRNESEISEQVSTLFSDLVEHYRRSQHRIVEKMSSLRVPDDPGRVATGAEGSIDGIVSAGVSKRSYVEASCIGSDIRVTIKAGSFDRLLPDALVSEIVSAWRDMWFDYNCQFNRLKR